MDKVRLRWGAKVDGETWDTAYVWFGNGTKYCIKQARGCGSN